MNGFKLPIIPVLFVDILNVFFELSEVVHFCVLGCAIETDKDANRYYKMSGLLLFAIDAKLVEGVTSHIFMQKVLDSWMSLEI